MQPVELSYPTIRERTVRSSSGGGGANSHHRGGRSHRSADAAGPAAAGSPLGAAYNSYAKFNPDQFEENSADWNLAMIQFLLDMKEKGHQINEVVANKVSTFLEYSGDGDPDEIV